MTFLIVSGALLSLLQAPASAPDTDPLVRMAATERAFAAATAQIGVRDGFLAFFSDDAIQIRAGRSGATATVSAARPALAQAAMTPLPLTTELVWAPYTGHVSRDGNFGWLTGAFTSRNKATGAVGNQGGYFTVWKRQANGTWRVWLDEGASFPQAWTDAAPLTPAPEPEPGTVGEPNERLNLVERAIAAGGDAWGARLASQVRLHRTGRMPAVGRDAAVAWSRDAWTSVKYTVLRTEAARSNNLAVTLGGYDAVGKGGAEHGTWVRVWKRDATGRWQIVFETSTAAR